jgi:twitching motility two-component system response regulator PilH
MAVEKVLVVDDSVIDLRLLTGYLGSNGISPMIAKSGREAIDKARTTRPDLILMDIMMPGMNGFETTRELQKDPELADIPIVLISRKDQKTDRLWAFRQGASDYLIKPVSEQHLLSVINGF